MKSAENLVPPVNEVVIAGNTMSMTCASDPNDSTIEWTFKHANEVHGRAVFPGKVHFERRSVKSTADGPSAALNLIINETHPENAGTYICSIIRRNGSPLIYMAELAVLR